MAMITRGGLVNLTRQLMDAVGATDRWSDDFMKQVLNNTYDTEWSNILNAFPYYTFDQKQVTTDANGQIPFTSLDTGTDDNAHHFYRVLSVNDGSVIYTETRFQDVPLATTTNYLPTYPRLYYVVDSKLQLLPVLQGKTIYVAVNYKPTALLDLSSDDVILTYPENNHIVIAAGVLQAGDNRRLKGEDLMQGKSALQAGARLGPAALGLMASLGLKEVPVYRRLRVAYFSTGNEILSLGESAREGAVYDSNRYTIHGMLTRLNCEVIDMGVIRDDPALIEAAFKQAAANADVVITSGGVSVGEADFVKDMLNKLGEVLFWKIAMKPGRPLAYGKIGGAHFFGLPGNPVSVMVTFYQFVRDAMLPLAGQNPVPPLPTFKVPCTSVLKKAPGRTEFQRGILSCDAQGAWSVRVTGEQGSGILRSMAEANCFIILPTDQGNVTAGTMVDVQVMEGAV